VVLDFLWHADFHETVLRLFIETSMLRSFIEDACK